MSHIDKGPLAAYNSLTDKNLAGYFCQPKKRRHLVRAGLVTQKGEIVSESTYRLTVAKKEHRKYVKDIIAQAIVQKTLELEQQRQANIQKKLDEFNKVERVRKIRRSASFRGNYDFLPVLSPRTTPQSPSPAVSQSTPRESASADNTAWKKKQHLFERKKHRNFTPGHYGYDNISPYLLPQIGLMSHPMKPSSTRPQSASAKCFISNNSLFDDPDHSESVKGNLMLHRTEPALMNQKLVQSLATVTMKYLGKALALPSDLRDSNQEILIEQQHCGGNTLAVFRNRLPPGAIFSFISRRHTGYPFSLSIFVDHVLDIRVSTCCEYKHPAGMRLGGKTGHFKLLSVSGNDLCYRCSVKKELEENKKEKKKRKLDKESNLSKSQNENSTNKDKYDNDFDEESEDNATYSVENESDASSSNFSEDEEKEVNIDPNDDDDDDSHKNDESSQSSSDSSDSDESSKKTEDEKKKKDKLKKEKPPISKSYKDKAVMTEGGAISRNGDPTTPKKSSKAEMFLAGDETQHHIYQKTANSKYRKRRRHSVAEIEVTNQSLYHAKVKLPPEYLEVQRRHSLINKDNASFHQTLPPESNHELPKNAEDSPVIEIDLDDTINSHENALIATDKVEMLMQINNEAQKHPPVSAMIENAMDDEIQNVDDLVKKPSQKFDEENQVTSISDGTSSSSTLPVTTYVAPVENFSTSVNVFHPYSESISQLTTPGTTATFDPPTVTVSVDVESAQYESEANLSDSGTNVKAGAKSVEIIRQNIATKIAKDAIYEAQLDIQDHLEASTDSSYSPYNSDVMIREEREDVDDKTSDVNRDSAQALATLEKYLSQFPDVPGQPREGSVKLLISSSDRIEIHNILLNSDQIDELSSLIESSSEFCEITLTNGKLTDQSLNKIMKAITSSPSNVKILNLSLNGITVKGLEWVMESVREKPSLKHLVLCGNPIGDAGMNVITNNLFLKDQVTIHKNIKTVMAEEVRGSIDGSVYSDTTDDLASARIDVDLSEKSTPPASGRREITTSNDQPVITDPSKFEMTQWIQELVLQSRGFSRNVIKHGLKTPTMTELNVACCGLSDSGIDEFSSMLTSNSSPELINLSKNRNISQMGWLSLGMSLSKNKSLVNLSLHDTNLGDEGCKNIADNIQDNMCLRRLNLSHCNLTDVGGRAILNLLKRNTSLIEIILEPGNTISSAILNEVNNYLTLNQNFHRPYGFI